MLRASLAGAWRPSKHMGGLNPAATLSNATLLAPFLSPLALNSFGSLAIFTAIRRAWPDVRRARPQFPPRSCQASGSHVLKQNRFLYGIQQSRRSWRPSGFAFPPYDVGLGRTLSGVVEPAVKGLVTVFTSPVRPWKHTPARVCFQHFFGRGFTLGGAIIPATSRCSPRSAALPRLRLW